MKAFKFSLESVQLLRRNEERDALESYARALRQREAAFERVQAADQALGLERAQLQSQSAHGCSAGTLARAAFGCEWLVQQLQTRVRLLEEAERLVQQRLEQVLRARHRLEALNNLEQRGRRDHVSLVIKEEQKFMDEFAQRSGALAPAVAL